MMLIFKAQISQLISSKYFPLLIPFSTIGIHMNILNNAFSRQSRCNLLIDIDTYTIHSYQVR